MCCRGAIGPTQTGLPTSHSEIISSFRARFSFARFKSDLYGGQDGPHPSSHMHRGACKPSNPISDTTVTSAGHIETDTNQVATL